MLASNFSEGALAEMWFEQLGSRNNFAADIRALNSLVQALLCVFLHKVQRSCPLTACVHVRAADFKIAYFASSCFVRVYLQGIRRLRMNASVREECT